MWGKCHLSHNEMWEIKGKDKRAQLLWLLVFTTFASSNMVAKLKEKIKAFVSVLLYQNVEVPFDRKVALDFESDTVSPPSRRQRSTSP
jgi:ABC-type iron transport system FetAB permease component